MIYDRLLIIWYIGQYCGTCCTCKTWLNSNLEYGLPTWCGSFSNTSQIIICREPSNTQPLRWGLEVCLRFCIQRASCCKLKQRIKVEKRWWSQPALWEWGCERRCQLRQPTHAEPVATSATKILMLIGIHELVFLPGHTPCLSYQFQLLEERSIFRIGC